MIRTFLKPGLCLALSFTAWIISPAQSVVSPSPSSSSVAQLSEAPVDLSTGVPQINLPLYTIESAKLSYPISISYHASGIQVNDVAGPLGTGWTLNSGGMINRIMRGRPDEQVNGFFTYASAIPDYNDNTLTLGTKDELATDVKDMMPDLFYYSTGMGGGGKIIFDNQKVPRTIPNSPVKIVTNTSTLTAFTITSPEGTSFEFEAGETATAALGAGGSVTYIASWYLSRIVSVDKIDTIRFNYTLQPSYSYITGESSGLNFYFNAPANASRALNAIDPLHSDINVTVTGTRYLSGIDHKGGKVQFQFSGGRTDDPNGKKLDAIIIYKKDPVTATLLEERRINFSYSYFQNTDATTRLRLDSFKEQLNATTFNPPYTFTYSDKQLPPCGSFAQDHWGYYNGAVGNTSSIPAYTYLNMTVSTANRNVNAGFSDACMLNTITSPLGGTTTYIFGSNQYFNGTANVDGPGLRVNKIITRDPFSPINRITNYEYTVPGGSTSSGKLMSSPNCFTTLDVVDYTHEELVNYNCMLIQVNATGLGNFTGAPVIYEYVTLYNGDHYAVTGKTVSKFSVYTPPAIAFPYFPVAEDSWNAGNLLTQEIYQVTGSTSTLVKKIVNTYDVGPTVYTIKGLSASRNKVFFFSEPDSNDDFMLANYFAYVKFPYLKQSDVYDYEQNSGTLNTQVTEKYYYDNTAAHLFPTKVEMTTTSTPGETMRTIFKYPLDYTATGIYAVMQNLNMTGMPLETTSIVENDSILVTGYQKTEFYEWKPGKVYAKNFYSGVFMPKTLLTTFQSAPANYTQLLSKVNAYDKSGFPVESEETGARPSAQVIDKILNRPVAGISNATSGQVAFSSFESQDLGNWKITTGTQTLSRSVSLSLSKTFDTFTMTSAQTITFNYTLTRSNGPSAVLTFTSGATTITRALSAASGSGTASLTAGSWNVSLSYDFNVEAIAASFNYSQVVPLPAGIVSTQAKTGARALQFSATQTLLKDSLPSGNYTVVYFQKGGTVTFTPVGGATVLSTVTSPAEADGWIKVKKEISITSLSQKIQLTGTSSMYLDELRLYPAGSMMTTTCYDAYKKVITQTDVNLRSQFMEYDERRRIKLIRDHEKNILKQYDYTLAIN